MKLKTMLLASALASFAAGAQAETFRAATWNGSNSANDKFLRDVGETVAAKTNGAVKFEVYPGGALLPAKGTLEGLQNGVAQLANITAVYIPSKLPVDFVLADLSSVADDQMALAFAKTEVSFFNDQMQKEIRGQDLVFATGFSIGVYNLICGFEVQSLDDFKGKRVRTSSDAQVGFIDKIGAVAVNAPANEIYTGIQRGTLDCTAGSPLFLTDFFKLSEVAKSVYRLSLGANANGGYYFNEDFWQDRTPEERRALLDTMAETTARSMVAWQANIDKAWTVSEDAGVKLVEPDAAAQASIDDFLEGYVGNLAADAVAKRGIEDPTALIEQTEAAIDKWKRLLGEVDRSDAEAVTALLKAEIFDKIDVAAYGLE